MPDESREKGRLGEEATAVALVPDIMVVSSDGKDEITDVELDDFSPQKSKHSGNSESQVEVGVAKTSQAPEPLKIDSLTKGTGVTLQAVDRDPPVDSNYNTGEEPPELDRSCFEKTNSIPPVNFSEPSLEASSSSKNLPDDDRGEASSKPKEENLFCSSMDAFYDRSQTRDSFDVRWDEEDRDEDGRSNHSRRTVKEGMCCCYQAFHRACLQCVEETPAMLSGLVLSLAFCIAIIVLIPTTRWVRHGETFSDKYILF